MNPVIAVLLGAAFLDEAIGVTTGVAGGAIVVAVALIVAVPVAPAPARGGARPAQAGCYPGRVTTFSLRSVRLRSGEEHRVEVEVEVEPFTLGGQRYLVVPEKIPAELAISRASTGTLFELRFAARVHGPCFRCLADTVLDVPLAGREYQATNPEGVEELRNPYLRDDNLDLSAWARDALALSLPEQILCRDDCAGLCAVCGRNLNDEPHEHEPEATDSRWAALAELRDRL